LTQVFVFCGCGPVNMGHGNVSDLAFFGVLAIVIQWFAVPDLLFKDVGPLKAQFSTSTPDMDAIIKLGAGILLTIGMAFSGVKWNPINGKMGGFAGFATIAVTAYNMFKADAAFVPKLFHVYLAVLFVGSTHIFFFASNPLVKKVDPKAKNNHGNMSDIICLGLMICAIVSLAYPDHLFMDLGPLKAQFTAKSADLSFMIRFVACVMLMWALILSGVKWNPINGKMAGLGGFICSGVTAYTTFNADNNAFVPRIFYIYAALMLFSSLHVFAFPSNPLPPKADNNEAKKKA